MAIETMAIGVQGKLGPWKALMQVEDEHPGIAALNLDGLSARAETQYELLEQQRGVFAGLERSRKQDVS